jgi:hypothetical protein
VSVSSPRIHHRARWRRPIAYRDTVADPPRLPRLVLLRSTCGHMLGLGYVWRHQGYIAWKRCGS